MRAVFFAAALAFAGGYMTGVSESITVITPVAQQASVGVR